MFTFQAAPRAAPPPARSRLLRWPAPTLAAWGVAWALFMLLRAADGPSWLCVLVASAAGLGFGRLGTTRTRQLIVAAGFPLSLLASGAAGALPGWAWLMPLGLLLLLYPPTAWRDAPLFPTPPQALDALALKAPLPSGARVLDAGCGLGHGLRALRRAYPRCRLEGVEWSWPLALAARVACHDATVHRADLWAHTWAGYDLVYLFQRPESMPRALSKARAEMADGSWLASLEFEAAGWMAQAVLSCPDGRRLWLYRLPLRPGADRSADAVASSAAGTGR